MPHRSFRKADHLPKHSGGHPSDPDDLPRQRRGVTPQMHGRYPDYDVLEHANEWDEVTLEVVLDRVRDVPHLRFFDEREARCLGAFLDVVLAQDREPRIPVLNMVDAKMHAGRLDGYQYVDMPDDRDTWRIVARGLDESAGDGGFAALGNDDRLKLVGRFSNGELSGGAWEQVNVSNAWSVVMRGALSEFYSHPWAWNEIGFGGPRYPRGYMRQGVGRTGVDPDEAEEAFDVDPVQDVDEQ
jgi:hypothetical protein